MFLNYKESQNEKKEKLKENEFHVYFNCTKLKWDVKKNYYNLDENIYKNVLKLVENIEYTCNFYKEIKSLQRKVKFCRSLSDLSIVFLLNLFFFSVCVEKIGFDHIVTKIFLILFVLGIFFAAISNHYIYKCSNNLFKIDSDHEIHKKTKELIKSYNETLFRDNLECQYKEIIVSAPTIFRFIRNKKKSYLYYLHFKLIENVINQNINSPEINFIPNRKRIFSDNYDSIRDSAAGYSIRDSSNIKNRLESIDSSEMHNSKEIYIYDENPRFRDDYI